MKPLFLLFTALPLLLHSQTGIRFESGKSWSQIKEAAKKSNKLIFLDAYSQENEESMYMFTNVYTQAAVGQYYNAQFINARWNMEEGEGLALAKQYRIDGYPTLLFIDGQGNLIHKVVGFHDTDKLLLSGKNAIDPNKQYGTLLKKYENHSLPETQYKPLIDAMEAAGDVDAATELASKVLAKNKAWLKEPQLELLFRFTRKPKGEQYQFLVKNETKIAAIDGYEGITEKMNNLAAQTVIEETVDQQSNFLDEEKAKIRFQELRPATADICFAQLMWFYAEIKKQIPIYVRASKAVGEIKFKLDGEYLDHVASRIQEFVAYNMKEVENAWKTIHDLVDSEKINSVSHDQATELSRRRAALKNLLESGLPIALESVKKNSTQATNLTVARIYEQLDKKIEAKKYAQTAIELGKKSGEDVSAAERLLKSL